MKGETMAKAKAGLAAFGDNVLGSQGDRLPEGEKDPAQASNGERHFALIGAKRGEGSP
jgi:hypothetical protein